MLCLGQRQGCRDPTSHFYFQLQGSFVVPLILCIATVVMVFKHLENIQRILNRTEIGLRSTAKGEKRVK